MFVITSLEQGGAEHVIYETVRALDPARYSVRTVVLRPGGPYYERMLTEGRELRSLNVGSKLAPLAFFRLIREIRGFRPDIVGGCLWHADVAARVASRLTRRGGRPRFVAHKQLANLGAPWHRLWIDRLTSGFVASYACCSESVVDLSCQQLRLERHQTTVIPNGRDLSALLKLQPAPMLPAGPRWRIGSVGRLYPQKDQRLLVEAIPLLVEGHGLDVEVWIAGSGPLEQDLRQAACALGVSDRLHLLGHCDDIPAQLVQADVYCMPSAYEGLSIAIVEAMAAARPIVATDVPGIRDSLDPSCAELVAYRDPGALAAALARLILDRQRARSLGAQARAKAISKFSSSRMVADLERLYDRLLG